VSSAACQRSKVFCRRSVTEVFTANMSCSPKSGWLVIRVCRSLKDSCHSWQLVTALRRQQQGQPAGVADVWRLCSGCCLLACNLAAPAATRKSIMAQQQQHGGSQASTPLAMLGHQRLCSVRRETDNSLKIRTRLAIRTNLPCRTSLTIRTA